jgi:hypothetical protein
MRVAIEQNLVLATETDRGECIAVDDETGEEYSHKWRDGEARVCREVGVYDDQEVGVYDDRYVDYIFRVRVELVSVESS